MPPLIGITADNRDNTAASGTYECASRYGRAVAAAGGLPVMLPHEPALVHDYVARCDGFVLTGGVDPDTRPFGQSLHPQARVMDPLRQDFEIALLEELQNARPAAPCLGVCLGMQLMALHAGGSLNQYLPDTLGEAASAHQGNQRHTVIIQPGARLIAQGTATVVSSHRQAVSDSGGLEVWATAPDGVIEAVGHPSRPFYLGVQWHPERNDEAASLPLNQRLFDALIAAARSPR